MDDSDPEGPTVRLAEGDDADGVAAIYAPVVRGTAISFEADPPAEAEMRRRIEATTERLPWLVCEHGGTVAGYACASPHGERSAYRWGVDVSVYVGERYRRSGVATGLYGSLLPLLRLQGFVNAYAVIALPNPASVDLHESLGFERIGVYRDVGYKLDEWRDVGHWGLALRTPPGSPSEPEPVGAVLETGEGRDAMEAGLGAIEL